MAVDLTATIAELRAALEKASPQPWRQNVFMVLNAAGEKIAHTGHGYLPPSRSHESEANATVIALAVNAAPALLAAAEAGLAREKAARADGLRQAAEIAGLADRIGDGLLTVDESARNRTARAIKDRILAAATALEAEASNGK